MAFTFLACPISGLIEVRPKIFGDSRGYFFEAYNEKDFTAAGIHAKFVQDNQSASQKGVLRGLHFQKQHPQAKLVRTIFGKVYDVAVDLRKDSPTFGKWHGIVLDAAKNNQLYIPEGFAHGYYVLSESAVFAYKCTDFYHPEDEEGIMWNDSTLKINWNEFLPIEPVLSEKDKKHPAFSKDALYFDKDGSWCESTALESTAL